MDKSTLLELTYRMLMLVLMLSLPVVIASVIAAVAIGILQAVTQVQDASIAYGAKLFVCLGVIGLTAAWGGAELLAFARQTFEMIPAVR